MTRHPEIDVARTVAIAMMLVAHAVYDAWWLSPDVAVDVAGGWWRVLQVCTASAFLGIVGVAFAVSHGRGRRLGRTGWTAWAHHARRAAGILAAALLVSAVTRVVLGAGDYVRFGILHCIGVTVLVLPVLARLGPVPNLLLALPVIVAGKVLEGHTGDTPGALVFGWRLVGGSGVDYTPLLPWMAPAMAGLAVGLWLYPDGARGPLLRRVMPAPARSRRTTVLTWPGRHSLPVYLLHQPVLVGLVALVLLAAGARLDPGRRPVMPPLFPASPAASAAAGPAPSTPPP